MKVSRSWATPLVAAVFAGMALTGAAMFFHLGTGAVHALHEWGGWLLIAGVTLHLVGNAPAFRAHALRWGPRAGVLIALVVVALAVVPLGGGGRRDGRAVQGTIDRIVRVPIHDLAPAAGRDAAAIVDELRAAGFTSASPDATLDELADGDRAERARALGLVFPAD